MAKTTKIIATIAGSSHMRKLLLTLSVIALCLCLTHTGAQAHVLIKSSDDVTVSAILHVSPDDDPIAGEAASLFFDIQGVTGLKTSYDAKVFTTNETGTDIVTKTSMRDNGVLATTIFPTQGVYALRLELWQRNNPSAITVLTHSQRVVRGVGATPPVHYAWADSLRIISVILLISLGIVAFNNRKDISLTSTF